MSKMQNKERIRYYHSYTDDFAQARDQNYTVPEDYKWVREDFFSRLLSVLIYSIAILFGIFYCSFGLHIKIKGRKKLKAMRKTGGFLYANHTQPIGDVLNPAFCAFPIRIYTVVSPANLSIPVIGRILPYLGALPTASTMSGMRRFTEAIEHRLSQKKCIVIYPEAHLWEYCAFIRAFPETSFRFPKAYKKPSYCMTTTYQKRRFGKKPRITIYVDGPFEADSELSGKAAAVKLRDDIYNCMCERAENSTYHYIEYRKTEEHKD